MSQNASHRCLCALLGLLTLLCLSTDARAEKLRKRYSFDYNHATGPTSEKRAQLLARKRFLQDFLIAKFSKEIVDNLAEDIDIALDPPEDYLIDFRVVGEPKINEDETKITITVEGDVDLAGMVKALVENKVLSFSSAGEKPPKVMFLASSSFSDESPRAAKQLRALLFDEIRQAGLQSVAVEGATETLFTQFKGKITRNSAEFRTIQKLVVQYNADYLVYVDTESNCHPHSLGGFVCDPNFIYTVMRPANNLILAENVINEHGSGNTRAIAFDKTLDKAAPILIDQMVGQLYQGIFADSDVIYSTPQLRNTISVTVYEGKSQQVQKIIDALQAAGSTVTLGAGTGITSNLQVETTLDTLGLYNFFNEQTFGAGAVKFKTPVVGYAENSIDIEITDAAKPPKRAKSTKPPAPKPTGGNTTAGDKAKNASSDKDLLSQLKSRTKPAVTLRLKPVTYNR